jgi:hypothetical protein
VKIVFGVSSAFFLLSILSSAVHADPPHYGGLPPGLQKKVDRGENLPPGWRRQADGYEDLYYEDYEPEFIEDKVVRIIKDVRELATSVPR